jgi:hypothetical protein
MKIYAPSASILVGFIDKISFDFSSLCFRVRIISSFSERVQTRGRKFYRGLFALAQINLLVKKYQTLLSQSHCYTFNKF